MFHEEIDKLQSEIDQLTALCSEANAAPETEEERLGILILKAQDGDLDEKGCQQLDKRLTEDDRSLRYYMDFQWLTAMLQHQFGACRIKKMLDGILDYSGTPSA